MITREPTLERLAIAQGLMLEPFGITEATLARALATIGEHRVDDADQRLPRGQAADHLFAERLFLDRGDQFLDHRQGHVGLDQRHPHFAHGLAYIGFGETRFAAQRLHHLGKSLRQILEHGHDCLR